MDKKQDYERTSGGPMTFEQWWEKYLLPNWKTIKIEVTEDMKTTAKAAWKSATYECRKLAFMMIAEGGYCPDVMGCQKYILQKTEEMMG